MKKNLLLLFCFSTMQILAQNNIPHPKTMLVRNPIDSDYVERRIGFPIVVKSLSGTHGKGVYLSENKRNFTQLTEMMEQFNDRFNIILQEFISDSFGKDFESIKQHTFLKSGNKINKVDILFKKIIK